MAATSLGAHPRGGPERLQVMRRSDKKKTHHRKLEEQPVVGFLRCALPSERRDSEQRGLTLAENEKVNKEIRMAESCSFCKRAREVVNELVSAGDTHICDRCVRAANDACIRAEVKRELMKDPEVNKIAELEKQLVETHARVATAESKLARVLALITESTKA